MIFIAAMLGDDLRQLLQVVVDGIGAGRQGGLFQVVEHAREALNFNLSMFLWAALALAFTIGTLGLGLLITIPAALLFAVVWFVCSIQAAVAGHAGKAYRYPLTLRIV